MVHLKLSERIDFNDILGVGQILDGLWTVEYLIGSILVRTFKNGKFEMMQKCSMVSAYPCGHFGQDFIGVCLVKQGRYKQMHKSAQLK